MQRTENKFGFKMGKKLLPDKIIKSYHCSLFIMLMLVGVGCHHRDTTLWPDSADMEVNASIESLEDAFPPIHSFTTLMLCGDTLIVHDSRNREAQFLAYDVIQNKYLGAFGKYGDGPNELANSVPLVYDDSTGIMHVINGNRWEIISFKVNEAISDSTYQYKLKVHLDESKGRQPLNYAYYVNDSTVLGTVHICNEDFTSQTTHIGRLNMLTGEVKVMDHIGDEMNSRSSLAVLPEQDRMITFGKTHDRIRIFDMNANLVKEIQGSCFKTDHEDWMKFFSSAITVGDRIYVFYKGSPEIGGEGDVIMEFDIDGNYQRSMKFDTQLNDMVYHPTTKRIYLTTRGTPQIGYLQL
jgi:hypothetical protein